MTPFTPRSVVLRALFLARRGRELRCRSPATTAPNGRRAQLASLEPTRLEGVDEPSFVRSPGLWYCCAGSSGSDLYAGGVFTTAGGAWPTCICQMEREQLVGGGFRGVKHGEMAVSLAVSAATCMRGGFSTAGGSAANYIAKWNGSSWTALGSGMNGGVYALAVSGQRLYAGGDFTTAGGSAANSIAKWDGSSWSALGSGLAVLASALAGVGAGGGYPAATFMRGAGSRRRAGVRPTTSPNGTGAVGRRSVGVGAVERLGVCAGGVGQRPVCGGRVHDGGRQRGQLTSPNGTGAVGRRSARGWQYPCVCAGGVGQRPVCGGGSTAGGQPGQSYIAKWNGSSWSALGSGLRGSIMRLCCAGGVGQRPVCGGVFTTAGGPGQLHRQMEREQLVALGSGMGGRKPLCLRWRCRAATCMRGVSRRRAGSPANRIAKWNGSSWSALGSG